MEADKLRLQKKLAVMQMEYHQKCATILRQFISGSFAEPEMQQKLDNAEKEMNARIDEFTRIILKQL